MGVIMPRRKRSPARERKALEPGAKIYAYARDSGGTSQEKSVTDQVRELKEYAAKRGWVIVGWYIDEARKSTDLEKRDSFMEMISLCHRDPRPVEGVLVWSLARLFRDELQAQAIKSNLRLKGVDFLSATDQIPEGPFAYVYEAFLDSVNRVAIDKMSIDVRRGIRSNVLEGNAPGGTPPVGYRAEKVQRGTRRDGSPRIVSRWVIDEERAPRVRQAFTMFAAGHSYAEIDAATHLYKSLSCYKSMISNRTYLGIYKVGDEEIAGRLSAIVDQDLWDRVQDRLRSRKKMNSHSENEYLLSGIIYCGHCSGAMSGGIDHRNEERGGAPWRFYRCNTKRKLGEAACPGLRLTSADAIERRIISRLLEEVLTTEHMQRLIQQILALFGGPEVDEEIQRTRADIVRVTRGIDNIVDAMQASGTQSAAAANRLASLETERAEHQHRMAELTKRAATATSTITDEQMQAILDHIRTDLQSPEIPVARRALRSFVKRIEIKNDLYRVEYQVVSSPLLALSEVPPKDHLHRASSWLDISAAVLCPDCGAEFRQHKASQGRCPKCQDRIYFHSYYQRNRAAVIERVKRTQKRI